MDTAATPPAPRHDHAGYTLGEEIAHSITHGVGLVGAIAALPWLILAARSHGDPWKLAGGIVFGVTAILLFAASTLYHALPDCRAKHLFRLFDHCAIYLLIAGTYTPFTLGVLRGGWGWTLFGLTWGLAIVGIVLKATLRFRFPTLSTLLYLALGWLVVIAARPVLRALTPTEIAWLVAGGMLYTVGVPFYVWSRRYAHAIWHVFVLGGATCHLVAIVDAISRH
jgi:hemolysin III